MNGTYNRTNVRVLVVEDNLMVAEMIRGMLEDQAYTIAGVATDSAQAIEAAKTLRPDVIVMDFGLPDVDGIETTHKIQSVAPAPVVMLTSYDDPNLVAQAGQAGIGAYLLKPPHPAEIDRAIVIAVARFNDMMQLRQLNADLQDRNQSLDAFAHTVAHDLKGPLATLVGMAEALNDYYADMSDEERLYRLRTIAGSGRKLDNIIDELLLLAGIRQMETIEMTPLDINQLVSSAMYRLDYLIRQYKPEIIIPETWPAALGYGPWVEEVWMNYLSNAIKYGGAPPRIRLGATELPDGTVRFWVRDAGLGLTPEEQTRLFIPFTRLDQVRAKGHGLGLSIVKQVMTRLGGSVAVESQIGRGSTFSFTLPANNVNATGA